MCIGACRQESWSQPFTHCTCTCVQRPFHTYTAQPLDQLRLQRTLKPLNMLKWCWWWNPPSGVGVHRQEVQDSRSAPVHRRTYCGHTRTNLQSHGGCEEVCCRSTSCYHCCCCYCSRCTSHLPREVIDHVWNVRSRLRHLRKGGV